MLDRLLLTAEGDVPEGGGTDGSPPAATPPVTPTATPSWYAPAESLKTSNPEVWQTFENGVKSGAIKDLPSLIVKGVSAEKKLGSALTMPNKDNPQEVKSFRLKLSEAGILPSTPENPDGYEVKMDSVPEQLRSDNLVGEFKKIAHEEGLSQSAVSRIAGLYEKMFTTQVEPALKYTQEQGQQAIANTAKELGIEPNVAEQFAGAWLAKRFSEEEMAGLERVGAANHPELIKYAVMAGRDTGEDISVGDSSPLSDTEFNEFIKTLDDPKHQNYQIYYRGDPESAERKALMEKREQLLKKKYPGTVGG